MKLFQYITLDQDSQQFLHSNLPPAVELVIDVKNNTPEKRLESFSDCEIAFGNIPAEWIEHTKKLKWLQLESVGFDPYLCINSTYKKQVIITNLCGFFGQSVAESALAGILALKRGIGDLVLFKEKRDWKGALLRSQLTVLHGSEVLIVGGGNIGQSFKKLLSGFDANIIVYDKNPVLGDITSPKELDKQINRSDIVFSCLPDCAETKFFFNEDRLNLISASAIFINVGRGAVVDEKVLVKLLKENRIGGVVLDVTANEPLAESDELWHCPNTILTQHTGGGSKDELQGKVNIFLDNLTLYLSGQALKKVVLF